MNFLVGADWRNLFDVIIVEARKPSFFTDQFRPMRIFDEKTNMHTWGEKIKIITEQNH